MLNKITKTIPNHWKLDSFRVEIPLEKVSISSEFKANYKLVNIDTGELLDLKSFQKKQALEHNTRGVKYYSWLGSRYNPNTKKVDEFLLFLVNAKMLYNDYFKGITNNTIEVIYNTLMSLNHFELTFEKFLECYIYDVDLCRDFYSDYDTFRWWTEKYEYIKDVNVKIYNKKHGGELICETLQFNHREKAKEKYPYAKFYSKYHESKQSKLIEFYSLNSIKRDVLKHLYRFEFTIKSKKMLDYWFKETKNTLHNYLQLVDDTEKVSIVAEKIHELYTDQLKTVVTPSDYKSIPMMCKFILKYGRELKKPFSLIESELNAFLVGMNPRTRQRVISQLKAAYENISEVKRYDDTIENDIQNMLNNVFGY